MFTGTVDAVCCLPSVTLDKSFAECFLGFAVCLWHTAKLLFLVVYLGNGNGVQPSVRKKTPHLFGCVNTYMHL